MGKIAKINLNLPSPTDNIKVNPPRPLRCFLPLLVPLYLIPVLDVFLRRKKYFK